jgi:Bacterial Ig-like domain (group 2)
VRHASTGRLTVAALIMSAMPACAAKQPRDAESWRPLEPIVRAALAAEREAFVSGDAEAALRASGLDTVHWPAVRAQADASVRRREFLLRHNHDYYAVLGARTTVDSARLTSDTATLWVTGGSLYALRLIDRDTTSGPSMGETVPHVFSFARRHGAWVLVRDSIISDAELHRHARRDPTVSGPPLEVSPAETATVRDPRPIGERRPPDARARQHFRDRNAMEADIARGPVPGYAGVIMEGPCALVVLLTDTLTQKAAAEAYFRRETEIRSASARRHCGADYGVRFRQVRYDFAQLYDWYVGPFRTIPWNGVSMTDIDEGRNQLAIGVEDSAAYRSVRRIVETLPIPEGVVRVHVAGKMCTGTGGPSVLVEVRDAKGRPAAIGTTIVIQDGAFKDSVDGSHSVGELNVGAGQRRPGRYEVRLYKPGYRPVVLRDVMAPGDEECQYAEPSDVRKVTLELLPDAPSVRSIVVLPPSMGLGLPDLTLELRAVVDADSVVSTAVRWTSSDTTVATISANGLLRSRCRRTTGRAVITATSVADSTVRGHALVGVWPGGRQPCEAPR